MQLVKDGRIGYRESFEEQAARADRTWGRYRRYELSDQVAETMRRFEAMREREIEAAKKSLSR